MSISVTDSSHYAAKPSATQPASQTAADTPPSSTPQSETTVRPSTTVTLSSGVKAEVSVYSAGLSGTPMSVTSAPELFVQGDTDGNGSLSRDEFAKQLKRVGISDAQAGTIFDNFNSSKNAEMTLDDYVQGIMKSDKETSKVFQALFASYTSNANSQFNTQEFMKFKSQGASVAAKYWQSHPEIQQRS